MSNEIELARTAARGVFHIFSGKIIARIVGVLGGIILIRLLKPEDYGLMYVAGIAPSILMLLSDFGIGSAMTKYLSEYRSKNWIGDLKPLFYSGLIFKISINCVLSVLCFLIAESFASMALGKSYMAPLIRIASPLILAWALSDLTSWVFLGLDSTKSYASLTVINEILLSAMPIVLVLYGMGVSGALLGMVIATIISSSIGVLASVVLVSRTTRYSNTALSYKSALRKMLTFGIPLAAVQFIEAGVGQYYRFMISTYCLDRDVGNYGVAEKTTVFIDYMAFPVATVLFPTFSKISYEREPSALKKLLRYSVKYSSFFILPVAVMIMILARPLIIFLFGIEYERSWIYLTLLAMKWLFYGLGGVHLRKLLLSQGETRLLVKLDTLSALIGVIAGLILIPLYGVLGYLVMQLFADLPSFIIKFNKAYKRYGVKPPLNDMARLYLSTIITGTGVAVVALVPIVDLLKLLLGLLVGMVTYIMTSLLINAITKEDINNLKEIMKPQPFINIIANKLFNIMEKIAK